MKNYIKWEDEMTDEVTEIIGSSRGDAQAVIEAHIDLVKKAYNKGYSPKEAAALIFAESKDDWDEDYAEGGSMKSHLDIAVQYGKMMNEYVNEKQFNKKTDLYQKSQSFATKNNVTIDSNNIISVNGQPVAFIDKINAKTGQPKTKWEIKEYIRNDFADGGRVEYVGDYKSDTKNYYFRRFNDAIGAFAWKYMGRYNEGILYALDDYDMDIYKDVKLKRHEYLLRYRTETMIGEGKYLIKINFSNAMLYFLSEQGAEMDEPIFETRGVKAEYIVVEKAKIEWRPFEKEYAKGGAVDESVQMVRSQAKEARHHADELRSALKGEKHLDPWVVAKMERATTDLSDVTHYIDGKKKYEDGGSMDSFDINEFLKYAHKEISYFLQYRLDGRTLTSNWAFTYNDKVYFIEPMVAYKAGKVNLLRTAHFVIYNDRQDEVGTIDFYKGKFTANSIEFDWIEERFKEGGKVCDSHCDCDDCKRKNGKLEEGGYVSTTATLNDLYRPFINDSIYKGGMDYVLGGFTINEWDNVVIVNSRQRLSFTKIKHMAEKRLFKAVEDYKNEVTYLLQQKADNMDYDLDREVALEMSLMLSSYLQSNYFGTDTREITDVILDSSSYKTWLYRIEDRVTEYNNTFSMQPLYSTSSSTLNMEDVMESTTGVALQDMLEMLTLINDRNEQ